MRFALSQNQAMSTPTEVASRVEEVTDRLKMTARPASREVEEQFAASLEMLKRISAGLRAIGLRYQGSEPEQAAAHREQLQAIVAAVGQMVADLARSNRRIAEKVGGQAQVLEAVARTEPGPELLESLGRVIGAVRQAAEDLGQQLDNAWAELRAAHQKVAALEAELERSRKKALHDALTQALSRSAFDEQLSAMVADGAEGPWSLLLLDIDHFKAVNDRHGHIVGDALLFKLARVVEEALGRLCPDALFYRYGGEEFAIVLPGKSATEARAVAERLRAEVAASRWRCRITGEGAVVKTTVSIGVAQFVQGDSVESLVERADRALYDGKNKGRNTVCVAESGRNQAGDII